MTFIRSIKLGVVIPAYNEADCIKQVILQWRAYLAQIFKREVHPVSYKIIVVNDGSTDATGTVLEELMDTVPELCVLHQANGGHGSALMTGYRYALDDGSDYVFQTDSDDQFTPEDFYKLWEQRSASPLILGYRQIRYDAPLRLVITRTVRFLIRLIYGARIMDCNIPYRLFDTQLLMPAISLLEESPPFAPNIFLSVLAKKCGQRLMDIPVQHRARKTGDVSIVNLKLLQVCLRCFKELWLFRMKLSGEIILTIKSRFIHQYQVWEQTYDHDAGLKPAPNT